MGSQPSISSLILTAERGEPAAIKALFDELYSELHWRASWRLAKAEVVRVTPPEK
jgi:hypothetical protein